MSENRTATSPADEDDWNAAVDWLLNSRHVELAVVYHFFHISNGKECDCDLD